ncbi:MAG: hypothetical protein KC910_14525, partial [Candidatus Eremiobacteraeota bacterium]|nr:hypothetical protein [Candidatus Eremiobacteraeota bacterium]
DYQTKLPAIERLTSLENIEPQARQAICRDLSVLPRPVLELLAEDGLRVVAVAPGQELADTGYYTSPDPGRYGQMLDQGRDLFEREAAAVKAEQAPASDESDSFAAAMSAYWSVQELSERLNKKFVEQKLGFTTVLCREGMSFQQLAGSKAVESPLEKQAFRQALERLNGQNLVLDGDQMTATEGVLAVPYVYHKGRPIPESLQQLSRVKNADYVEAALGIHNSDERVIILHSSYVLDPAKEVGHYRVTIHELGHAIDHALERALGPGHRQAIDGFFAEDKAAGRFLTERASDNVREYFAEAVEAFFTLPLPDGFDGYKTANNRLELKRQRPELFAYLEQAFAALSNRPAALEAVS